MRGPDEQTSHMFSYLSPEQRVRQDHPLRAIRAMTDAVFASLSKRFTKMYAAYATSAIVVTVRRSGSRGPGCLVVT